MATHTVIQDIEAEDKFLGPLTLKQFIFAAAGLFFGYLNVFAASRGAPILMLIFIPPSLLGFFLAIPWSKEQPTETWVLAKIRFRIKPKARVWDQAGLEELVTISAPKKVDKHLTNGLNQDEVQSRLKALAETIDTRGWALKHATYSDAQYPVYAQNSERLIDVADVPQEVPEIDIKPNEDMLDEDTVVSENFDTMIQTSSQERREESLEKMQRVRDGEPLETIQQPEAFFSPPEPPVPADAEDVGLSQQLRNKHTAGDLAYGNMKKLRSYPGPASRTSTVATDGQNVTDPAATPVTDDDQQAQAQMTNTSDPAILNLAQNNDWTVDTIARTAKRNKAEDEVVISLR